MSVSICLPHPVAVSAFMICRGLCACTEMLWMCVLYVSFGSKVRRRTFGCIAMGSGDRVSVGHAFWLRWCGWCRWGVGRGLDQGRERWGGVMSV